MENMQAPGEGIGELFSQILDRYSDARHNEAFAGKHEISDLFDRLRLRLKASPPVQSSPSLSVVSSYGKGNWATIPWLSVLDARETDTTQRGTYVVYLFREDGQGVWVKLAQGVTDAEQQFKAKARDVLKERAERIRELVTDLENYGFDLSGKSDLGTDHKKARMYEASTIASKFYPRENMPPDDKIIGDLQSLITAYDSVIERGGNTKVTNSRLALVGTWGSIRDDITSVANFISEHGSWASPWTFKIKDAAAGRLGSPFTLYLNGGGGQIVARARVVEMALAPNANGMESPWPAVTSHEFQGKSRFDGGVHDGIKTWLKLESIELVPPFRASELTPADGLSVASSILNQMTFGYVWEKSEEEVQKGSLPEALSETSDTGPSDFGWLVEETLLPREMLEAMIAALRSDAPQILFAGPPGTGKTWVAQRLARHLTRGRHGAVRTVQFHPSYTYESFIEGIRPRASASGVHFELTPGVVIDMVNTMRQAGHLNDSSKPYVIVIDEANRANLPRVLGELLFLFEYRNEAVALQYTKNFQLPKNLLFIGTMNTSDRSIRSIDAALRRRFEVFELGPSATTMRAFFAKGGNQDGSEIAAGLEALNAELERDLDRHHTIGHSFFMKDDMSPKRLSDVWDRQVYPLIEEYFFDQPDLARAYTVDRFWPNYVS